MSGAVDVLVEPGGVYVVACFRSDCPEHGAPGAMPWVNDHDNAVTARAAATAHRAEITAAYEPTCPTCGQATPSTTDTTTNEGYDHD